MKTAAIIALALSTLAAGYASAADTSAIGKTREQVRAELIEAQRTGDIVAPGHSGQKLNELRPDLYPAKNAVQGYTRAQVQAELLQAQRSGELTSSLYHGG